MSRSIRERSADASAFTNVKEEELRDTLVKMGFRDDGREAMYDGLTGKKLEGPKLIGAW